MRTSAICTAVASPEIMSQSTRVTHGFRDRIASAAHRSFHEKKTQLRL
jgi:hypothetical protein